MTVRVFLSPTRTRFSPLNATTPLLHTSNQAANVHSPVCIRTASYAGMWLVTQQVNYFACLIFMFLNNSDISSQVPCITDVKRLLTVPRAKHWWLLRSAIKVKVTLVQALGLCTGRTAHRASRGIALPFITNGTRRGWGVSVTPRPVFIAGKDTVPIVQ
jgi:hypothetical protein